jgi:hypothetical protein
MMLFHFRGESQLPANWSAILSGKTLQFVAEQ